MKKALYVVLIVIALGLFYVRVRYSSTAPASSPAPEASVSPTTSLAPAAPVLSEKLDNAYFTLSYPKVATYSARTAPDSREWVISYRAEGDRPQGAINDGYLVSIMRFETNGGDSDRLQAETDRDSAVESCSNETSMEIKDGKLGSLAALTFDDTCSSSINYYVLMGDILYRASALTVGGDAAKAEYQVATKAILNSLSFK
ncbi:hypothetical protein KBD69_04465 [Candidatus Woesebacteria bacterium]|nr:hypothetical protein [Candidatus Woesebacteria bacterium]